MLSVYRFIAIAIVAVGCAPLPDDQYERNLVLNDRESMTCNVLDGITMTGSQNAACQARAGAKRQQIVAEEMQRRQEHSTQQQTKAMQAAIEANAAQPTAAPNVPLQWCMMIVDGSKAIEGCYPDRAECNRVWADVRATGKATTDCTERAPTVQPTTAPAAAAPAPTKWCMNVRVEGGTTTESCYADEPGCRSARGFHGNDASECVFK